MMGDVGKALAIAAGSAAIDLLANALDRAIARWEERAHARRKAKDAAEGDARDRAESERSGVD